MLSELKETLSGKKTEQLAAQVAEAKNTQEVHSKTISYLKDELSTAKSDIKSLLEKQQQLINENTNALRTVKELKEQLSESIDSIKVMSSTIQNTLVKRITSEITMLTQDISLKLTGSEKLKNELEQTTAKVQDNLSELNQEIKKLQAVSSNIKAGDFELTKFSSQLKAADSEKLQLMRQIDSLQRLVSSLRRQQS